jgi:hypothetical protein
VTSAKECTFCMVAPPCIVECTRPDTRKGFSIVFCLTGALALGFKLLALVDTSECGTFPDMCLPQTTK